MIRLEGNSSNTSSGARYSLRARMQLVSVVSCIDSHCGSSIKQLWTTRHEEYATPASQTEGSRPCQVVCSAIPSWSCAGVLQRSLGRHPCVKSAWSAQYSINMQITTTDVAQLVGALLKRNFGGTWQTRSRTDQRIWSGVSLLNHSRAIRKIKLISDGCCGSAGKSQTSQLPLSHIDPKPPGSRSTQTIHPLSESSWMETLGGCAILGPQTAKSKPCQVACLGIHSWSSTGWELRSSRCSGTRMFVKSAGGPRCSSVGAGSWSWPFFQTTIIDVAQLVGVLSRNNFGNIWRIRSWKDRRTRSGASLSNQRHAAAGIKSMLTTCLGWAGRSRSISHCPRSPTHSAPA